MYYVRKLFDDLCGFCIFNYFALQTETQARKIADTFTRTSRLLSSQLPSENGFMKR